MDKPIDKCKLCDEEEDWLYLHSACHIESPTWARVKGNVLEIVCAECEKLIVQFRVRTDAELFQLDTQKEEIN
jgi:hypothetical protein